jgi:hypothetical protein
MKHRIDTDEGRRIYSHRMWVVEPVFANITTHKRLSRLAYEEKQRSTHNGSYSASSIILRKLPIMAI